MSSCWGASVKSATSRRIRSATAWAGRCAVLRQLLGERRSLAEHRVAVPSLEHAVGDRDEEVVASEHVALRDVGDVVDDPEQGLRRARARARSRRRSTTKGGGWPALTEVEPHLTALEAGGCRRRRVRKRARRPSSRIAVFSRSSVAATGKPARARAWIVCLARPVTAAASAPVPHTSPTTKHHVPLPTGKTS